MRFLILSDVHANRPALDAVLADAEGCYDRIACLGDLVGYGGDPNAVVEWAHQAGVLVVRGNHDRACAGDPVVEDFSPNALTAALWTREQLSPEGMEWLRRLPPGPLLAGGFELVHGSPRDEDEYILNRADAAHASRFQRCDICFFGHTHSQGGFAVRGGRVWQLERPKRDHRESSYTLEPETRYLLNPGSVGQPRDRDWRAAYALYEHESRTLLFRRCEYDVEAAQVQIVRASLPAFLARRLELGI